MLEQLAKLDRYERQLDRLLPNHPDPGQWPTRFADFVPALSPQYVAPVHLGPYLEAVEATLHGAQRVVLSVPPRHAKTDTTLHAPPYLWSFEPAATHAYVTYEDNLAKSKSRKAQLLAKAAGHTVSGTLNEWRTSAGGCLLATGIGGPLTGRGVDGILVIDDPVKNRAEAESPTIRNRTYDWAKDVAFTRLEPGASCIVVQTRWHPDDLAGRLIKEGWCHINLCAVDDDTPTGTHSDRVPMGRGKPLWPARWPMLELELRRKLVGEYSWASLFQGRPVPRGSRLYGEPTYYDALPTEGYRVVYGLDLAYTAKTSADWTVCVKLLVTGRRHLARAYVADVRRLQVEAPQSGAMLARLLSVAPGPIWWHGSGPEKGSAQLFNQSHLGGKLRLIATTMDKFTRALDSSEAWNDGRILVPRQAPWLAPFLGVVQSFTGVNDDHDDDVDALGSGWAAGQVSTGSYSRFRRHKGVPSRL